jgi:uncharacterized protein YidB (DUF937 family)
MSGILGNILGAAGGGDRRPGAILGDLLGSQGDGLNGVIQAFEKGGLGDVARSWVGTGANLPISAEQIESVLGSGPIADIAARLGVDPKQAATQVSAMLPQLIDQLTPGGQVPSGGLGDLLGRLKF